MAFVTDIRSIEHSILSRLAGFVATLRENRERRKLYNQTVRELSNLTNRELADLGLHRAMISRVAYEAAFGK
ncbi:MAG: DUF1127 domain-containing protein [Paracoccaceae bacterium]